MLQLTQIFMFCSLIYALYCDYRYHFLGKKENKNEQDYNKLSKLDKHFNISAIATFVFFGFTVFFTVISYL